MIPFIDLQAQQRRVENDVKRRLDAVLAHGRYVSGPEVAELEERLAGYVGVGHAVCCSSGTDALLMALMALGVGPGQAVFTTPFTFIATAEVVALLGAVPVFVDVDPVTFNLDPDRLALAVEAVRRNDPAIHPLPAAPGPLVPAAVIPVDLFGLPADYDRLLPWCAAQGLPVIEDAAQAFGSELRGRRAGSFGWCGATSFFPAKPLGCYGDGGAVFTDDAAAARRLRSIRSHGQGEDRYHHVRLGLNGRLDSFQAAVLLAKLAIFDDEVARRRRIAAGYAARLAGVPGLVPPVQPEGFASVWAQYTLLTPGPDVRTALQARLAQAGTPTMIYYPVPLHLQAAFRPLGHRPGDFPVSERLAGRVLSLPMHPYLDEATLDAVCAPLRDAARAA